MRILKTTVLVPSPEGGEFLLLGAGVQPPDWMVEKYADEDIWVDGEAVTAPQTTVEAPTAPADAEPTQSPTETVGGPENADQAPLDDEDDLIGSTEPPAVDEPARNGSLAEWISYAQRMGATAEDLEGKTRNQIRAAYGRD